jgi:hypothetical protein
LKLGKVSSQNGADGKPTGQIDSYYDGFPVSGSDKFGKCIAESTAQSDTEITDYQDPIINFQ